MVDICIGDSLDDFLAAEGILETVTANAVTSVVAWQIERAMKDQNLSRTALASRMGTSRLEVNRLLDGTDPSVTLEMITNAACALRKNLTFHLVN